MLEHETRASEMAHERLLALCRAPERGEMFAQTVRTGMHMRSEAIAYAFRTGRNTHMYPPPHMRSETIAYAFRS